VKVLFFHGVLLVCPYRSQNCVRRVSKCSVTYPLAAPQGVTPGIGPTESTVWQYLNRFIHFPPLNVTSIIGYVITLFLAFSIFIGSIKQNPAGEADCQLHGI